MQLGNIHSRTEMPIVQVGICEMVRASKKLHKVELLICRNIPKALAKKIGEGLGSL